MARLQNLNTRVIVNLLPQHIIGRHPASSHTVLDTPDTSRTHATIGWDGHSWQLHDSSTNGTFINGKLLRRGQSQRLNTHDKICFASLTADIWLLLDSEAPKSLLLPESPGLETITLDQIAVLPNEEQPEVTLYLSPLGQWVCESQSGVSTLQSGDRIHIGDSTWRFVEALICEQTITIEEQTIVVTDNVELHFNVSQNEEHVWAKLKLPQLDIDLGERTHHYLLLLLARKRLADLNAGINESERGWLEKEQLSRQLGMSETHINIQVYRFRKQIVKALPSSTILPQVIERRSGEIRLLYDNLQIRGGMNK